MAESWQHRYIDLDGLRMHYVEQGEGFPVVLCHGWPETWYCWRYQIPALADVGFRVIAPDLRGYGDTDKPPEVEAYDIHHLVGDVIGLLGRLGIDRAAFVGHDWGSNVVWMTALMYPERVERVVSLSIMYRGRSEQLPTDELKANPHRSYALYFQLPGLAEAFFNADLRGNLQRVYETCAANPNFLSEEDLDVYVDAFEKGGFSGPLNYYRNMDSNWRTTEHLGEKTIDCPALLVLSDKQRTPQWPGAPWTPLGYEPPPPRGELPQGLERWAPNLRVHLITECGHWVQQEKPNEVNDLLLGFLSDLRVRPQPSK